MCGNAPNLRLFSKEAFLFGFQGPIVVVKPPFCGGIASLPKTRFGARLGPTQACRGLRTETRSAYG